MKTTLLALFLTAILLCSCVKGVFTPVNVGREYGSPKVPRVVSHLPEANQWAMYRTSPHYFLRQVICFDYTCRKMIGRRKVLKAITFEDFKKRVGKNAKKGVYKKSTPSKTIKPDTLLPPKQPERIAVQGAIPKVEAPILKADSLITLSEFLFETNSHKLKGEHFSALDSIGQFLQAHPTLQVSISGHTDITGSERHNVSLSLRRAEVVAEYLIDHGAVYERVTFEGFGSSRPIGGNDTAEGRSRNRRVEILIRNPRKE